LLGTSEEAGHETGALQYISVKYKKKKDVSRLSACSDDYENSVGIMLATCKNLMYKHVCER